VGLGLEGDVVLPDEMEGGVFDCDDGCGRDGGVVVHEF